MGDTEGEVSIVNGIVRRMGQNGRFKKREGFTLIELLVFVAIFTIIIGSFIAILVSIINIQTQQIAISDIQQQGQFLTQQLQYYIQGAKLVNMPVDVSSTALTLRESSSSIDPTIITFTSSSLYLQQGSSGTPAPLTSSKVTVSNVSFTRHFNLNSSSSVSGTDSVSYSFTLTAGTGTTVYSQTFQSSVMVLSPINKIAMVQQVKSELNNASVSNISGAFSTNISTSSLLVAVVANNGLVTSTITDTLGNTWALVGSTTYPSYADKLAVYAASNSSAGADTVTVNFASGASYAALYLYEYRGSATSSAVDTWAAQVQANTSTPSSPSVSPTSTVELLLGVNYNANTAVVPSPGAGYILETSSTPSYTTQLFVEDQAKYISGPVIADWNYSSGSPSSTALIATFK